MDFDLSDDQKMLRGQAMRLVADKVGAGVLRRMVDDGRIWDQALYREMAELGFFGITTPEIYGGLGLTELDLGVVAEGLGHGPVPVPFSSSVCLAAEAIRLGGSELQKERWLPGLATGEIIGTVAFHDEIEALGRAPVATRFANNMLNGCKSPVPDAPLAQIIVVAAQSEAGQSEAGQSEAGQSKAGTIMVVAELDAAGVSATPLRGMDKIRPHARISFNRTPAEALAGDRAAGLFDSLLQRAAIYTAFEQIGGADTCLEMARRYALERRVFGQPIGTYQAIKHKLANMLTEIEIARSNAFFAAWAADASIVELPAAAASARLTATAAYEFAARENVHIHGGIGYTWEGDCQFHHARARLLALSLGGTEYWSDRLIAALPPTRLAPSSLPSLR